VTSPRYCNVFRHSPSGRDQKRLLNRAIRCALCGEQLGRDRRLYRAYTGFTESELIPAHPACGDDEPRRIQERRDAEEAERAARSERFAAEARVRSRLIVVGASPAQVRPARLWP
jgi:hypothetical protein